MKTEPTPTASAPHQLKHIRKYARLLDSKFTIPGTGIRFGWDSIIGLVPYGGELITFFFSSGLVVAMVQHGASGYLVGRMLLNVLIDTIIGGIPIIGDIFDVFFKANQRNYRLMERHYQEGKYQGSIWKVLIPAIIALVIILGLLIWLIVEILDEVWEWLSAIF
jgi:NADH:ubiquinone oxidoreductase subunit 5 (subunit L)/multisubunit Na+/H+ antiporter MnhA subunit